MAEQEAKTSSVYLVRMNFGPHERVMFGWVITNFGRTGGDLDKRLKAQDKEFAADPCEILFRKTGLTHAQALAFEARVKTLFKSAPSDAVRARPVVKVPGKTGAFEDKGTIETFDIHVASLRTVIKNFHRIIEEITEG
jgi:hypothetical protein